MQRPAALGSLLLPTGRFPALIFLEVAALSRQAGSAVPYPVCCIPSASKVRGDDQPPPAPDRATAG